MDNKRNLDQLLASITPPPPSADAKHSAIKAAMAEFEHIQQEKEKNSKASAINNRPSPTALKWITRLLGRGPMTKTSLLTGTVLASAAIIAITVFFTQNQAGYNLTSVSELGDFAAVSNTPMEMRATEQQALHMRMDEAETDDYELKSTTTVDADFRSAGESRSASDKGMDSLVYEGATTGEPPAKGKQEAIVANGRIYPEAKPALQVTPPAHPRIKEKAQAQSTKRRVQQAPLPGSSLPAAAPKVTLKEALSQEQQTRNLSFSDRDTPQKQISIGKDEFTNYETNPIKLVAEEPISTFSVDVDTASYSFVRRQLRHGVLPPKDAIRLEELINYFDYDYPAPNTPEEPFLPTIAVYPCPWNQNSQLLHIGIKGLDIPKGKEPPLNLVFLLDTSGSMQSPDKLGLLKDSFRLLVEQLGPEDTVSIVTYAGTSGTVLEPTSGDHKAKIISAIENLHASGSTAGAEGIRQAYALAEAGYEDNKLNRVILATDGDFNVGITNPKDLQDFVERMRDSGIFLSVLGFGHGNYKDDLMQTLAQNGNGNAFYIDNLNEARKVLVDEISATMFPIAKDVKIQVEFNPENVAEYRLLGYETRMLNREDFNNDKVDAAEIGAGHSVTAIYEIFSPTSKGRMVDHPRYTGNIKSKPDEKMGLFQNSLHKNEAEKQKRDEIAFLKIRYKLPTENTSRLITRPIDKRDVVVSIDQVDTDIRFAASVAAFGQILRGGLYTGDFTLDDTLKLAKENLGKDKFGYRAEFLDLIRLAKTAQEIERQ